MKTYIHKMMWCVVTGLLATVLTGGTGQCADVVTVSTELGNAAIVAGDKPCTAYLKIGLTGVRPEGQKARPPLNIALVIDRSGSMQGEKIAQAREGACRAVDLLSDNDIISVVAFSSGVEVIVPATKASDRERIKAAINKLNANGGTALFAGVSKGAAEARKFLDAKSINRVVLLSDGQANEGPSTVTELGELGASLAREGMAVSTVGLGYGYNEDLMAELASRSEGNFVFAEKASELTEVFRKGFHGVMDVVSRSGEFVVRCAEGVTPVRTLTREMTVDGSVARGNIREIYVDAEKYVLIELSVAPGKVGAKQKLADVEVTYDNMLTGKTFTVKRSIDAMFVATEDVARKTENAAVMVEVVRQIANENNKLAMRLRDEGKAKEAREQLLVNAGYLAENASVYNSEVLKRESVKNNIQSSQVIQKDAEYEKSRKGMLQEQNSADMQTSWSF